MPCRVAPALRHASRASRIRRRAMMRARCHKRAMLAMLFCAMILIIRHAMLRYACRRDTAAFSRYAAPEMLIAFDFHAYY